MVKLDEDRSLACVTMGLFLLTDAEQRLAVLVARQRFPSQAALVEVVAPELETAEVFLAELLGLMVEHNVYRKKVISLSAVSGPSAPVTTGPRSPAATGFPKPGKAR